MTQDLFLYGQTAAAPAHAVVRPEARLVERVCDGDAEAFDELYWMFVPLVHGILLSRVPYDDVKDLVQEVFIGAYQNLPGLRDRYIVGE